MNEVVNVILWFAYIISLYFTIFILLIFIDKKESFKKEESSLNLNIEPIVSILIPAFNEEKTILKTLKSVNSLDYPKDKLDILVLNDGSKDKTEDIIKTFIANKPHFKLLSHKNRGKAASLNRGLTLAKGEYFACLDADSFVEKETLRKMLSMYEKENDPELAIITPAMKVAKPKGLLQKMQWIEYIVIIFIARVSSHIDSLYVAPGPFSVYRTSIVKEIGGFDEENITEDQEIAYRVQQKNYRIKQCFDGYVYTTAPNKIKPFFHQRRRWYLGGMICLHKYKNMIGKKKYGDFGIMQLVKNLFGYILAITGITLAIHYGVVPFLRWIKNLIIIKFDIIPSILNLKLTFDPLLFLLADFKKMFIVIFLFAIGFYFFFQAHKNANERVMKLGWIPLIPYFAFYYLLKGIILLLTLFEFSRGKKVRW